MYLFDSVNACVVCLHVALMELTVLYFQFTIGYSIPFYAYSAHCVSFLSVQALAGYFWFCDRPKQFDFALLVTVMAVSLLVSNAMKVVGQWSVLHIWFMNPIAIMSILFGIPLLISCLLLFSRRESVRRHAYGQVGVWMAVAIVFLLIMLYQQRQNTVPFLSALSQVISYLFVLVFMFDSELLARFLHPDRQYDPGTELA